MAYELFLGLGSALSSYCHSFAMKHIKTPLDPKMRQTARIFAVWHFSFVKCPRWPAQCIVKQLCRAGEAQYTCSAWTRPEARHWCQHAPTVCQQVCSSLPVHPEYGGRLVQQSWPSQPRLGSCFHTPEPPLQTCFGKKYVCTCAWVEDVQERRSRLLGMS